ncbi:lysoplasmalogenase [Nocardioides sp. CER19]|uniref:lysoplasmalogenase n=1 Tax=Nocardioides sp. CER19 TaxID=3038538 RepID=UPI00244C52CE|nr:lysoplasmalogenase [Nocardioides sp. CER19]MDH2415881.1 lysoplasmalogenase [Nocardioides sp. CER19]
MTWATAILTAALALLNWVSVACGWFRVEWWTKLLTMVALIATVLVAGALDDAPGTWLVVALAFGLLGDAALLGDTERRLLAGVAAFFVGHLAYLVCFVVLGVSPEVWWPLVVVVLIATSWPTRALVPAAWRHGGPRLAVPLLAYTLVIAAMTVFAFLTGEPLLALGATLFVVSDSLIALGLARNEFAQDKGSAHVAVMVTYHVSQALLAVGVLVAR